MIQCQYELSHRTWANNHAKIRQGAVRFSFLRIIDDGGRNDLTKLYGIVEMAKQLASTDKIKRISIDFFELQYGPISENL